MAQRGCGHPRGDHAKRGPKPPHANTETYAKQIAVTVEWKLHPILNGAYVLYPTTDKAFCENPLCTCTDFIGEGKLCGQTTRKKKLLRRGRNSA